jgi:hypothetical protein
MAGLYNNLRVSYAIDRTRRFYSDEELREDRSASKQAFGKACLSIPDRGGDPNPPRKKLTERRNAPA